MIKFLGKLIRRCLNACELSEQERSQCIINRIKLGGGYVGKNVDILSSVIDLGEPYLLRIGDNVTLTGIRLLTHDASTKKELGLTKVGRVTIGNDVFVGIGCIILPNTTIGNRVIIGAGSVVASDIPDNSVACGSPCRVVGRYDEYMNRMRKRMKEYPCIELLPADLLDEKFQAEREQIIKAGYGFIQ